MRILICTVLIACSSLVFAQDNWENLVTWEVNYNEENTSIELKATIQENWVIYSQFTPEGGPIPLSFEFEDIDGVEFIGKVEELTEPIKTMSKMFELEVIKFKNEALFSQKIKTTGDSRIIKGNVTFMSCDNEKCLPPKTVPFEVKI